MQGSKGTEPTHATHLHGPFPCAAMMAASGGTGWRIGSCATTPFEPWLRAISAASMRQWVAGAGSLLLGPGRAGDGWPPRPGTRGRAAAWAPARAAETTSATPSAGTAGSGSPRPIVRALSHPEPARPCPFHEAVQGGPLGPLGPRWRIGPGSEGDDQMRCAGPSSGPSHGTSRSHRRAAAGPCPSRQKREARPASRALGDQMPVNMPTTGSAKISRTV